MARAIRAVTIERGRDPRDFTLIAFGGSGPVHACDVAAALDIPRILIPVSPGVFTAVGMLASDVEHHFVRAVGGLLGEPAARQRAAARLADIEADARATLAAEGYEGAQARLVAQADLRYTGQGSELTVALPAGGLADVAALRAAFEHEYAATYGHATDEPLEIVNVRAVAAGVREHRLDFRAVTVTAPPLATRPRPVHFTRGAAALDTPVVARDSIGEAPREGPLIVESYDSTVAVPPGATIARDRFGNLVLSRP
jgi:N-methylhydantoinase A